MALLGNFIDVRTIGSLGFAVSTSFAHGLPSLPDFVLAAPTGLAGISETFIPAITFDATGVTFMAGKSGAPCRVVSVVAHSLIR